MKNNLYPCKPQFYCIKVGFKGVKIILACFRDEPEIVYEISFQYRQKGLSWKENKLQTQMLSSLAEVAENLLSTHSAYYTDRHTDGRLDGRADRPYPFTFGGGGVIRKFDKY